MNYVTKIDKADVARFSFTKADVLENEAEKITRRVDLERAMKLGNLYKEPVTIQFEANDGDSYETEASIWAVTEKNVQLKGNNLIPIRSIFRVKI